MLQVSPEFPFPDHPANFIAETEPPLEKTLSALAANVLNGFGSAEDIKCVGAICTR